ncbi:hypothetical protein [Acinetobacter sp. YH12235]|uniref:hypothetical protein n=1 Tax=Acinetobacter sp. YH12235 TaxID=2601162 RepID=UPI0015D2E1CF|nr:hypothetical protein [Acinetobacter sp. YH12235]
MDIEKLKAEFEQSECFKRLEHVAQYTFFEFGAYIKRTDVPADIEKKCGKLITALLFSWSAWKEAKAQAVPEWFVAKEIKPVENDSDEKVLTWDKVSGVRLVPVWSFKSVTDVTHWMPLPDAPQEPAND